MTRLATDWHAKPQPLPPEAERIALRNRAVDELCERLSIYAWHTKQPTKGTGLRVKYLKTGRVYASLTEAARCTHRRHETIRAQCESKTGDFRWEDDC